MATKLEAQKRNWEYLLNASEKGKQETRFRLLCDWFFGETPNIEGCAQKAYADLRRGLSGIGDKEKISVSEKDEYKDRVYAYITKQIKVLLGPKSSFHNSQSEFDNWHKNACMGICEKSEYIAAKGIVFNYGHAQKWLNMTLKNMLVAETAYWWADLNGIRKLSLVPNHFSNHSPVHNLFYP